MKALKRIQKTIAKIIIFSFLCNSFVPIIKALVGQDIEPEACSYDCNEEYIEINNDVAKFIEQIIINAVEQDTLYSLPESLLRCYERILNNTQTLLLRDLLESFPILFENLTKQLTTQEKAPRPAHEPNIAGPGTTNCNLSPIIALIELLQQKLNNCCATLISDFQQTWTILAAEFNGTFSAINNITCDASGTFTAIEDVKNTLTACCANIDSEFQQTWTILASLNPSFSIVIDLSQGFKETWTILAAGFNGTFTAINALSNAGTFSTLNACCNATFSAIADLKATVSTDFIQTWSILNDIKTTITDDFAQTWTILADIRANINSSTLAVDFSPLFTAIDAGFNGTFTALDACCTAIINDIDSSTNSIISTIDACCAAIATEFQETWTILGACSTMAIYAAPITISQPGYYCLSNDVQGTISLEGDNIVFDLNSHTIDGNGGVGVVTQDTNHIIKNGRITNATDAININQSAQLIISDIVITNGVGGASSNGIFSLLNTVTALTIQNVYISDVGTGINISGGGNPIYTGVTINNFNIVNTSADGIVLANAYNSSIRNGKITTAAASGLTIADAIQTRIANVSITGASSVGLATNACSGLDLKNTIVANSGLAFDIENSTNGTVDTCKTYSTSNTAFFLAGCSNFQVFNCSVDHNFGIGAQGFSAAVSSNNIVFKNCTVQNLVNLADTVNTGAFVVTETTSTNIQFYDCVASNLQVNSTDSIISGFLQQGTNAIIDHCTAENLSGQQVYGFNITGTNSILTSCIANNCSSADNVFFGAGFFITAGPTSIQNCQSNYHNKGNGFQTFATGVTIGNSIAINNVGTGFLTTGTRVYWCFATGNSTNYSGVPDINNISDQVDTTTVGLTGPFAGLNLFA